MLPASLRDGSREFEQQITSIQSEVAESVKQLATNKIGKVSTEKANKEAIQLVSQGFEEFKKRLTETYTVEPWNDVAQMMVNGLRNSYFYNHNHLLGDVKRILLS